MEFLIYLFIILYSKIHSNNLNNKNSYELKDYENLKYLEYSFKRNLTLNNSLEPEEFFKTYFYNQLYINIIVGSKKKEIPFYFFLQEYPFAIQSANIAESQVKGIYNESESTTFTPGSIVEPFFGDIEKAIYSKDNFYFNNNKNSSINFYLCK